MTKPELITAVAEKSKMTKKDSETIISAFIEVIAEELSKGGNVKLNGFGVFDTIVRPARECRNPHTGEMIFVEARKFPKFKASKNLKDSCNN